MQPVAGEVTIICLTDEVNLRDLGVRLTRGAKVEVPLSAAMKSRDLQRAKVDGTVFTQTLRASAIRAHEYASSDTTTSQSPRFQPPAPAPVDMAPLLGVVQALTEEVRSLRAEVTLLKQAPAPVAYLDPEVLRDVLSSISAQAPRQPVATHQIVPTQPPDDPVFIPERIMDDSLKPSLDVKSHRAEASGVDDAAKTLRSVRKRPR